MKAVGFQENLPIENTDSLQDIEMEIPVAQGRDILVEVKAISVNPVDYKIRHRRSPAEGEWSVIGWDAAGIVKAVGSDVTLFEVGDEVWYAGDLTRPGSNAEFQLVDERIVGRKPTTLSFSEAAALPLTSLTAWELLFDRMQVDKDAEDKVILVIGAAGGRRFNPCTARQNINKIEVGGHRFTRRDHAMAKVIGSRSCDQP